MTPLVTLEQTKQALHVDGDDDDGRIAGFIDAATVAVVNYMKVIPADVPADVQNAAIMLVGYFMRETDGDSDGAFDRGYLPKPVTALLYPYRDPTLA